MSTDDAPVLRKPRIALMGEFSAGKSTLSNLLLGARPLPESVTATCLSPVWITKGPRGAVRECLDGTMEPVSLADLHSVPIENTRVIRLSFEADLLDDCDLLDCPGISDPNMPSEVWERLVPEIDAVLWCTHATQAWRQSEAAVWEGIPEDVRARSLLLITRFDKLKTERDKLRVLARVKRETEGQFAGIYPIALLQALAAGDDAAAWEESGAHNFAERLMGLIAELSNETLSSDAPATARTASRPAPAPAPDLADFTDVAPERRGSLFDMADTAPSERLKRPTTAPARPEAASEVAAEAAAEAVVAPEDTTAAPEEPKAAPEAAPAPMPTMNPSVLTEALSRSGSPRTEATIRPMTLEKKKPIPTRIEDAPSPEVTGEAAPVPRNAVSQGSVLPRRVASPGAKRTERPTRKSPVAKNPDIARSFEPSLDDLRNAFSTD